MTLRLRPLTEEEDQVITQISRSGTEEARLVERARMLELARDGLSAREIARRMSMGKDGYRPRKWITRFNEQGLEGLQDAPRSGAPARYEADVRAKVLATALAHPQELGLPFASWTIERLHTYVHEQGIWMGKTRMFEILQEEGLRWYKQEGWFGERVDPQFAEKRGP